MFRSIQLMLTISVLFAMSAVAQAAHIPLLYNNTDGLVVFDDNFEGHALGDLPSGAAALVGTWSTVFQGDGVKIDDVATAGVAAYEGSQFLTMKRLVWADASRPNVVATGIAADSGNGDDLTLTLAFRHDSGGETSLYLRSGGTTLAQIGLFGAGSIGVVTADGQAWQTLTQTSTPGEWNTLVINHTNGTTAWSLSTNGSEFETRAATGNVGNWDTIKFYCDDYPTIFRFDAVVPEPSTLALLATGLIGLLCYAWRKRR